MLDKGTAPGKRPSTRLSGINIKHNNWFQYNNTKKNIIFNNLYKNKKIYIYI